MEAEAQGRPAVRFAGESTNGRPRLHAHLQCASASAATCRRAAMLHACRARPPPAEATSYPARHCVCDLTATSPQTHGDYEGQATTSNERHGAEMRQRKAYLSELIQLWTRSSRGMAAVLPKSIRHMNCASPPYRAKAGTVGPGLYEPGWRHFCSNPKAQMLLRRTRIGGVPSVDDSS